MLPAKCPDISPASLDVIRRNLATAEIQAEIANAAVQDLKEQEAAAVFALGLAKQEETA